MLTLALLGDVMLGRGVNAAWNGRTDAGAMWGDVLPILAGADVRIANLECALTTHKRPWTRTEKVFHFQADPAMVRVLQTAHIDACSLANNHTLDFEEAGLLDTMRCLASAGIRYAGAGRNAEEAAQPAFLEVPGTPPQRLALLAFTDNEPAFAAAAHRPGTNYLPVSLTDEVIGRVADAVAAARRQGAALVVFSNHWGPNMVQRPVPLFRRFAQAVIDCGADVYFGHSAHVFQGVELYRGKPIFYDTGDFIDDYAVHPWLRNDWSFVFRIAVEGAALRRIELFPVVLEFAEVRRATERESEEIVARMEELSAEMGTSFVSNGDCLLWQAGQSAM